MYPLPTQEKENNKKKKKNHLYKWYKVEVTKGPERTKKKKKVEVKKLYHPHFLFSPPINC
jgi:hypothetical protein